MFESSFFKCGLLSLAAGVITTTASAQLSTSLDATVGNSGWYDSYGEFQGGSYFVGSLGDAVHRNFFIFDRSPLKNVQILKASVEIFLPASFDPASFNGGLTYASSNPNDTGALFSLYKFDGSIIGLRGGNLDRASAFADLGGDAGGAFGSRTITAADNVAGGSITVDLSAYFLTYLNGVSGQFALAGALTDLDAGAPVGDDEFEYMFGWVENLPVAATLHLEFVAVPEPSTYGLVGAAGLLGLVAWRRRAGRVARKS